MEEGKKRLAVLVGCNYPNTRNELHGCINDVHTMRDALVSRFGFGPDDIELLTDAPGARSTSRQRQQGLAMLLLPTGANIRAALGRMVDRAQPGDVLYFHYSGHGTWIPSKNRHGTGGSKRDEAIVPCDFNLITDVDFRQLVNRLPAGASFTIVSDSCHSGGLIEKEKEQIGPSSTAAAAHHHANKKSRAIPFDSILHHLASLSGIDSPHVGDHLSGLFGADAISPKFLAGAAGSGNDDFSGRPLGPDDGILLSGCQADETSADMCEGNDDARAYGAFSNAVQMVLREQEGPLSNRELVTRARQTLDRQGFAQHPCLYCSDDNADAPFLFQQLPPKPRRAQHHPPPPPPQVSHSTL